jgi:hypothetical protein
MSEQLLSQPEEQTSNAIVKDSLGKITVLEALAEEIDVVSPTLSWQSAWSNKEDR